MQPADTSPSARQRDPATGRWKSTHNVRRLEEQRSAYRNGTPLPEVTDPDTDLAIQVRVDELAADRGGREKCNALELSHLVDIALCDLLRDSVVAEVRRRCSLFVESGSLDLLPVFNRLATFMNTKRLHALAIGIRPDRADTLPSLEQYLAAKSTDIAATAEPVDTAPLEAPVEAAPDDAEGEPSTKEPEA